ncbi:ABC transporter ATP-binding protein [Lacrimispora sp. 38-1]|uniref:ABC transporter ATP-binding protein n=1 Tax=Lacrimispora sp. 38-1 TaxID=3125778 RepID=UPI003CFA5DBE
MLTMILRILKISGKNKPKILLGIFFNILKTFSMAMMIFAIFLILNNLNTLDSKMILNSLWIIIGSIGGRFFFQWLMDITMSAKGFDMFRDYRLNIGDRLKKAPMGYFSEQRLGTIQTVLTSTVVELEQYSMLAITDLTGGIFMALIMTILFLFYNPLFSALTLLGLSIGMWVLRIIQKRGVEHTPLVQAAQENLTTQSLEYIRGIAVMRAFSVKEDKEAAVYEAFERKKQADLDQEHAVAGLLKWYAAVYKITGALLMLSSAALYLAGSITLPYCLMFIICAFLVYAEMEQMGDGAFLAKKITTELDRLEKVTNMPVMDTSDKALNLKHFDIEFKNVSFGYDSRTVIDQVSLKVPQGTTCAIVGPSGSGKTTLCNLIARFWDVKEGEVLIDGYPIKDYTADSLLKYISMVFQNVYLFHDTIENNIRFGYPNATKEQLIDAAKRARCHDFIMGLPEGYHTIVGEGGSTLSGGEKQRISIARAILKDAPIIILDEATSSVDPENEHELLGAIKELTKGKTLISIAHRLTTVRDADQILVIDSGSVAQQGTHEQLIKEEGIYSRFWKQRRSASGWKL